MVMQGQTGVWGAAAFLVVWLILRFLLRRIRRRRAIKPTLKLRSAKEQATFNTLRTIYNPKQYRRKKR
jgi:O-antigen/teichoic acid export membrane protein